MWNPNRPLRELPEEIRGHYIEFAQTLYHDLINNRLQVIVVPAPEPKHSGHGVRHVENSNPEWYRELYHSNPSFRRDLSTKALDRLRKQEDRPFNISPFKYDSIYRGLIHENLIEGFETQGLFVPPREIVKQFFNTPKNL